MRGWSADYVFCDMTVGDPFKFALFPFDRIFIMAHLQYVDRVLKVVLRKNEYNYEDGRGEQIMTAQPVDGTHLFAPLVQERLQTMIEMLKQLWKRGVFLNKVILTVPGYSTPY